jgi:hypothetical protein
MAAPTSQTGKSVRLISIDLSSAARRHARMKIVGSGLILALMLAALLEQVL